MKLPNFFVVGAPKCGTTSLHFYLREHPDIFMPQQKELHYFSYPEVAKTYYNGIFAKTIIEYKKHYATASLQKAVGDASPSYLYYNTAAHKIKTFNSDAKIIIMLRNPVERCISHYLMDQKLGYQKKALSAFLTKDSSNNFFYKEYIECGLYYQQVKNYSELFGWKNIFIINIEDLKFKKEEVIKNTYSFLGVDDSFIPNLSKIHNKIREPKFEILKFLLKKPIILKLINHLPRALKDLTKPFIWKNEIEKPLFLEEQKQLQDIFEEDLVQLNKMLSQAIPDWTPI